MQLVEARDLQCDAVLGSGVELREHGLPILNRRGFSVSVSISAYHGQQGFVHLGGQIHGDGILCATDVQFVNVEQIVVAIEEKSAAYGNRQHQKNTRYADPGVLFLPGGTAAFDGRLVILVIIIVIACVVFVRQCAGAVFLNQSGQIQIVGSR